MVSLVWWKGSAEDKSRYGCVYLSGSNSSAGRGWHCAGLNDNTLFKKR